MHRWLIPGLLCLGILTAGCSVLVNQSQLPASTPSAAALAAPSTIATPGDYFPLKSGTIWGSRPRYLGYTGEWHESTSSVGTSTFSITSTETASDSTIAHMTVVTREGLAYSGAGGGGQRPEYEDVTTMFQVVRQASGDVWLSTAASPSLSLCLLHLSDKPGSFSIPASRLSAPGNTPIQVPGVIQNTSLEPEVIVPAGKFTNCLKIEFSGVTPISSTSASPYSGTILWLAKDVGLIKHQHTYIINNVPDSTMENRLATYSIPSTP